MPLKKIREVLSRPEYQSLEQRCIHQDLVFNDPSMVISNTWYDGCFTCTQYNECKDYKPIGYDHRKDEFIELLPMLLQKQAE